MFKVSQSSAKVRALQRTNSRDNMTHTNKMLQGKVYQV
eukprot:UN11888